MSRRHPPAMAFTIQSTYPKLIDARQSGQHRLTAHGWRGVRVGRNEVWKVTRQSGERYFVKFYDSKWQFRRDLVGLDAAHEVAARNSQYCAPTVLNADGAVSAIATTELSGPSLRTVLSRAFRMDQNPLRRSAPIQRALDLLHRIIGYLRELHGSRCAPDESLLDHSVHGIVSRISRKLSRIERLSRGKPTYLKCLLTDVRRACSDLAIDVDRVDMVPVFGDPVPDNIMMDGGRVGLIDFEDYGLGDPARDWVMLLDSVTPSWSWWHWSNAPILELLSGIDVPIRKSALIRAELHLDQYITQRMWQRRRASLQMAALRQELKALPSD